MRTMYMQVGVTILEGEKSKGTCPVQDRINGLEPRVLACVAHRRAHRVRQPHVLADGELYWGLLPKVPFLLVKSLVRMAQMAGRPLALAPGPHEDGRHARSAGMLHGSAGW